jgi:dTDP-4-dehydrorhamnose 3,5-epimerase
MSVERRPSLLETTLAAAARDRQMAAADGTAVRALPPGVHVRRLTTHADARGSVVELLDPRWNFHPDPIVFAYAFTIRPGVVKGWNLHKEHDDRYAILQGELEVVMFDPRPESPNCGKILRVMLSERDRSIVSVPRNVWHADHNVGSVDAVVVNFPTMAYDHANPDKYRLPIDTDLIPHSFHGATGW